MRYQSKKNKIKNKQKIQKIQSSQTIRIIIRLIMKQKIINKQIKNR